MHVFTSKLTLHDLSFATAIATVCVVCWLDVEVVLGGGLGRVGG